MTPSSYEKQMFSRTVGETTQTVIQGDCLEYMKTLADKSFDLVIADPPYGLKGHNMRQAIGMLNNDWDEEPISAEYLNEVIRISKNQIIWGGNYFNLLPTRCFLIWDKMNPQGLSFADCEMAWTSFDDNAKIYRQRPQNMDGGRIHPTQKPVELMKWCLEKYSKESDTILDPFLGSGTTLVAAKQLNRNAVGIEISAEYCAIAKSRLEQSVLL